MMLFYRNSYLKTNNGVYFICIRLEYSMSCVFEYKLFLDRITWNQTNVCKQMFIDK